MPTLGLVTVGQAPRPDITTDIKARLPSEIDVLEAGALDEYDDPGAIEADLGAREEEAVIVTLLQDGSSVVVDRDAVFRLAAHRISELALSVDAIGVLCTAAFPLSETIVPVLEPSALLRAWANAITPDGRLGILVPKPEQAAQARAEWPADRDVSVATASPYDETANLQAAADELEDVDLVLLKCMGYDYETKQLVRERLDVGALLPRSLLCKTVTELFIDE